MNASVNVIATLKCASRKEAIEAIDLIGILRRSGMGVTFIKRSGNGRKNVEFFADNETSAKEIRNRYFRNCQISYRNTK